jgi:hypothetical protein
MKNIIFDLGNVVIDINLNETYKELAKLSKDFSWEDGERLLKRKADLDKLRKRALF